MESSTTSEKNQKDLINGFHTVIECGYLDKGQRVYFRYCDYFGKDMEVFFAESDTLRRPLYRARCLGEKLGFTSNKVGMYLFRKNIELDGVYCAQSFTCKQWKVVGLKPKSYFITEEVCVSLEKKFKEGKRHRRKRSKPLASPSVEAPIRMNPEENRSGFNSNSAQTSSSEEFSEISNCQVLHNVWNLNLEGKFIVHQEEVQGVPYPPQSQLDESKVSASFVKSPVFQNHLFGTGFLQPMHQFHDSVLPSYYFWHQSGLNSCPMWCEHAHRLDQQSNASAIQLWRDSSHQIHLHKSLPATSNFSQKQAEKSFNFSGDMWEKQTS